MFKVLVTLARGKTAAAGEALADREALPLLDQQLRDSGAALDRARRALAFATAQDAQEARRSETVAAQLADLESRAGGALAAGRNDLATEAAEAIATLEMERDAGRAARAAFAAEIRRLRRVVADAGSRLAAVERGRRVARAAEAVRRLRQDRAGSAQVPESTLDEAEATLARLRAQQEEHAAAMDALDRLDAERAPASIAERLGEAGFGKPTRPTAASVLARLRTPNTP